jgi:phytoene desaturase
MKTNKHIIIVGAGPGGLASAMLLAAKGFRVSVFEKQKQIGGRSAEIKLGEYTFDLGPTFLMMKYLMDELFEVAGFKTSDFLDCRRLDPMYRLFFENKSMLVFENREKMKHEIEKLFPGESVGLDDFYDKESKRFEKLYPCLQKDYSSLTRLFSKDLISALPHIALGNSLYDVLGKYFKSESLKLAFTFQSKYLGMSPWECPGLFAMIPYTEHAHGIYHVMGGLNQIPQAFSKAAQAHGAEIKVSSGVKKIFVENKKFIGVELESGEKVLGDEIILNADFGYAVKELFDPHVIKKYTPQKLENTSYSCSTFMMYLGLDKQYDCEHHSIVFSHNYKKNLKDISENRFSNDISVYIRNSAALDPQTVPKGHSALYILAPMPNTRSGTDWEKEKSAIRKQVINLLEERSPYKNIEKHIKEELIITPSDWENKSFIYKGATFNMGHNWNQMLYFRPHNKFEEVDCCYLVGGGTHPGSGLPTIFESARISASLICKKYKLAFEEPKAFKDVDLHD